MIVQKPLSHIISYKANLVTFFRIILLFISVVIFPTFLKTACGLFMVSVVLDYVDGMVARKYHQCSFFGECLDWFADISSSIVMFMWWYALEPHLAVVFLVLICAELGFMVVDLIAKANHFSPIARTDEWITYILEFTMQPGKQGYRCKGLGYWNMIIYYVCGVSRIIFMVSEQELWWYAFIINVIPALSYSLMNTAYTKNILNCWTQKTNQDGSIQVIFIEKQYCTPLQVK